MSVDVVTLRAGALTSRWVPSVGMVGVSLFRDGRELLGRLGGLDAYRGQGSTFGIGLLHPWADRLGGFSYRAAGVDVALDAAAAHLRTDDHGLPVHGLVAAHPGWSVREVGPTALAAELDVAADPDLLAAFPFPHLLALEVALEPERLTITTTLTPTTDQPVPVAFGFQPCFLIPGVPREQWVLRTPALTRLTRDRRGLPTGERAPAPPRDAPLGVASLDDHLTDLGTDPAITLAGGDRAITVRFLEGYTHLRLFAPAKESVVAIEPMTAPTDALRSGDGLRCVSEPFRAVFAIEVPGTSS